MGGGGTDVINATSFSDAIFRHDAISGSFDGLHKLNRIDLIETINAGAGDDLIVGGVEPTDVGYVEGDTAVYDSQAKYFKISVKEMEFNVGGKVTVSNFSSIAEDSTIKLKKAGEIGRAHV